MRVRSLGGLAALGLTGTALADSDSGPLPRAGPGADVVYTCPAAATATVFVTVGPAIDPVPPVVVKTITATVWPAPDSRKTPAAPTLLPTLTVTIDSYGPPPGGSQYTGPKPWDSAPLTSTVYNIPTPVASVPANPGNIGGNPPPGSTIQGGQITPGVPGNNGQVNPGSFTITLSPGQSPPVFPWNPWNPARTITTTCTSTPGVPGGSDGSGNPGGPGSPDGSGGSGGSSGSGGSNDGVTVITRTLYHTDATPGQATPAVDVVVASFTVTFPQPAASGVVVTQTAYLPSGTELPSGSDGTGTGTGGPGTPGGSGDSVTSFTTTLYRTRPGSGSGTPTVDTLVTCFTVTFPSATGTAPPVPPNVSVGTIIVPTLVPGPDGSLSYSMQTLVSSFIVPPGAPTAASASVLTTTYLIPGSGSGSGGQDPASGTPAVATLTLTLPQSPAIPVIPGVLVPSASGPTVVTATIFQTDPGSPATPVASVVTVVLTPGVPPAAGIPTAGAPGSPGSPGSPGFPATPAASVVTVVLTPGVPPAAGTPTAGTPGSPGSSGSPGSPGSPVSVVTQTLIQGTPVPSSPNGVITQTIVQSDPIPGSYGDAAASVLFPIPPGGLPSSGIPPVESVTVTIPAAGSGIPQVPPAAGASSGPPVLGSPPGSGGILGGYSDPAQSAAAPTVVPGALGSPTVITLWPTTPNAPAGTAQATAPGAVPGSGQGTGVGAGVLSTDAAIPAPGTQTTSCTSTLSTQATEIASTAVATSTLVNVLVDATTTYTFPYESLVTSVGTATVTPGAIGGAIGGVISASTGGATVTSSAIGGAIGGVVSAPIGGATAVTAESSVVLSTLVQSTLIQSTLITSEAAPTAVERRDIHKRQGNSTATSASRISIPTPMCSGTTEVGILTLDFDDLAFGPLYNPYHRFWFSKGFLVGPPPAMPYLPSSGGRLLEYVPPMLSNSTGMFSKDTAQIGMGNLASSPCFQFDFYNIDLGCDARNEGQLCEFIFTGYHWNATEGKETEFVSQRTFVPSCPEMANCNLTSFSATGFSGLSSLLVTLRVDGHPQVWWADDLQVGWSNNDCESANCRQQHGQAVAAVDDDPVFFWTMNGIRVLRPSRIHKHFSS